MLHQYQISVPHGIDINSFTSTKADRMYAWCNDQFSRAEWNFDFEIRDNGDMRFSFREEKDLLAFIMRWA